MKKRFLFITILLAVSLFSVAAAKTDNWKISGVTVCFSANKNGIELDNVLFSATGQINETMTIQPQFRYSPANVEDSGLSFTLTMQKPSDPEKIGGVFALLSKLDQYQKTEFSFGFKNPEKGFSAIEFSVTSSFRHYFDEEETSSMDNALGFLISLTGDYSRTDLHFNSKIKLANKYGLTTSGKLHYLDRTVKCEDIAACAEFYVTKAFTPSLSFEYSYDNAPQENGLYAVLNLSKLRTTEDTIEINAYAKAGAHIVDNNVVCDVKKASISTEYRSNIDVVNRSGSKLCFKTAFEYVNDCNNTEEENGFFAKILVSGRYFGQYANRSGFAFKIEQLENIEDLDFKLLSENYISTLASTDFPK